MSVLVVTTPSKRQPAISRRRLWTERNPASPGRADCGHVPVGVAAPTAAGRRLHLAAGPRRGSISASLAAPQPAPRTTVARRLHRRVGAGNRTPRHPVGSRRRRADTAGCAVSPGDPVAAAVRTIRSTRTPPQPDRRRRSRCMARHRRLRLARPSARGRVRRGLPPHGRPAPTRPAAAPRHAARRMDGHRDQRCGQPQPPVRLLRQSPPRCAGRPPERGDI